MRKIKGRNMLIFVDDKAIAGNTDCSIQIDTETIEVAPTSNAQWREYITKCSTWKASSNHIVGFESLEANGNVNDFMELQGQTVTLMFTTVPNCDDERSIKDVQANKIICFKGQAIVTSISISAKNGSHASGSFEFQGTGELTHEQADFWVDGGSLYAKSSEVSYADNTMDFVNLEAGSVADQTLNL